MFVRSSFVTYSVVPARRLSFAHPSLIVRSLFAQPSLIVRLGKSGKKLVSKIKIRN